MMLFAIRRLVLVWLVISIQLCSDSLHPNTLAQEPAAQGQAAESNKEPKAAANVEDQSDKAVRPEKNDKADKADKAGNNDEAGKANQSGSLAKPVPIDQQLNSLDNELKSLKSDQLAAKAQLVEIERRLFDLNLQQKFLGEQVATFGNSILKREQAVERLLRESDQWISFSQQIAPIFQQHCTACHHPRNPQGRYDMTTYAAIMAPGESGPTIEPGSAQQSYLYQLLADHSMPQKADPLSDQQIQLVRKWIDLGARLDPGASAKETLFRLSPRPEFPQAPELYASPLPVSALALSPDGQVLASSGYHEVLIWSLPEGKLVKRLAGVAQRVYGLAFDPQGKWLAVASGTPGRIGDARVLDIQSGKVIAPLLVSPDSVLSLAISNDGQRLAVGETNGSITIFDVGRLSAQGQSSGQLVCIDDHSDWINSLAWSTDDRWLVSASRDKTCKVFDAQSGKLLTTFAGHQHNATGALFTADGNHIASVGDDGRLRIWSRIEAKQESELTNVAGPIQNLATWGTDKALIVGVEQKLLLVDIGKKAKRIGQVELPANQNLCVVASASGRAYVGSHTSVISQVDLNNPNDLPRSFPARPMASPSANPSVD